MQAELVERARDGDKDAFASLVSSSIDGCYALAYRILRDPNRAQDATQQAMLGAWRDLPTLRDSERFDAWLHRLVVHACYTEARGERRHLARVQLLQTDLPTSPDVARSVVLHHHLGYPLTEIAATLGIPVGTARSRLHYAVRQLRIALDADDRSLATSEERPA